MKKDFNRDNHPERLEDEVFITNASTDTYPLFVNRGLRIIEDTRTDWECIGWKTKRAGNVAYDIHGNELPGYYPIFAKKSEIKSKGGRILERLLPRELKK